MEQFRSKLNKTVEFNSSGRTVQPDGITFPNGSNSAIVEICSAMASGKDMTEMNKKHGTENINKVNARLKELGKRIHEYGDPSAKAEFNTIMRLVIMPQATPQMELLNVLGTHRVIGWDEQMRVRTVKWNDTDPTFQAVNSSVEHGFTEWKEYIIDSVNLAHGFSYNYRQILAGNYDTIEHGKNEVITRMLNKQVAYTLGVIYNKLKNNNNAVKYFYENSKINKTALDDMIKDIRTFGSNPTLTGDFSVVSQVTDFALNTFAVPSLAMMDEMMKTGLLSFYKGSPVVEFKNQYNVNQLNSAGDNFQKIYPEGILYVIPQGVQTLGGISPIQSFTRGEMTTRTEFDIQSGNEVTRFDLEFGADVAKGFEYMLGMISDTDYDPPTMK